MNGVPSKENPYVSLNFPYVTWICWIGYLFQKSFHSYYEYLAIVFKVITASRKISLEENWFFIILIAFGFSVSGLQILI